MQTGERDDMARADMAREDMARDDMARDETYSAVGFSSNILTSLLLSSRLPAELLHQHQYPCPPQAGGLVLVDGAHAVGSVPHLDVPSIAADFYTSNLHK